MSPKLAATLARYRKAVAADSVPLLRDLCLKDLFFLLTVACRRVDLRHQWFLDRCDEVQASPDGYLDLWFREAGKSSVLTFGKTLQDILRDPEVTIGIFSHTRPVAKAHLRPLKRELETNVLLKRWFADVLWAEPERQAPVWSEDSGIVVRRKGNPKEPIDCDEPILTTEGWKRHGELIPGDRVFGPDGRPTTVVAVTGKWTDLPCYRVSFGNHSVISAGTHLWEVSRWNQSRKMRRDGSKPAERWQVCTTEDLRGLLEANRSNPPGVRVTHALQMDEVDLPIDPYVLGVWLGDGQAEAARFVSSREDFPHFASEMQKAGHDVTVYDERQNAIQYQLDKRDRAKTCRRGHDMALVDVDTSGRCKACKADRSAPYTVNGLSWRLRRLDLMGNKHVPEMYLMASEGQRLALLQGLMDTDGCAAEDGQAIFANTNEELSEAVYFLAASLGMKPSIKRRERLYKNEPHIMWWVTFAAHVDCPPFRMRRKIENCSTAIDHPRRRRRVLTAVELVESRPVSCIQVDNAGCYLVGKALITTHNSTVEAWGLVEGMPVGKHFDVLVFDDIVTPTNAGSPEMRTKTLEAWEQSLNLGKRGGIRRIVGTRYHWGDAYGEIISRKAAVPRIWPCEIDGEPVLLSREELDEKRRDMGPWVFASQMYLSPTKDSAVGFQLGWLRQYQGEADGTTYAIVDPANSKRKKSDYTAAWVLTAGRDQQWYVRWFIRDRLSLVERINLVFWMHRTYQPLRTGYEEYGLQADIEAIRAEQDRQRYRFDIVPLGGKVAKYDRIQGLAPILEQRRIWFPQTCFVDLKDTGLRCDMVDIFRREEYECWPYSIHEDLLDSLARINDPDLGVIWPRSQEHRVLSGTRRMIDPQITSWVA